MLSSQSHSLICANYEGVKLLNIIALILQINKWHRLLVREGDPD